MVFYAVQAASDAHSSLCKKHASNNYMRRPIKYIPSLQRDLMATCGNASSGTIA
ncbi:MAG: hypothetical protein KBI08_13960 [Sphingobium sp.]|nr:hypothetical protein [Sphingobium sp.]MBP9156331.1 hypothetical protein [Sphingobium sp.]